MKKENETIRVIRGFLRRFNEDHVGAYAAQSAYFILLSFIPFVLLLVTLVQYTPLTQEIVTTALVRIVPEEFSSFVEGVVREIFGKSPAYVPLSAVIALWSAGKGVNALTNGLNCVYRVEETRGYLINRLRSTVYTLIFVVAVVLTLILLVFGNQIQAGIAARFPMIAKVTSFIIGMRTFITLVFLGLVFLLIYKFVPNRRASFKSQIPGAMVSAVAWSLFSLAFSVYIDFTPGSINMYGSLTTLVLIMLWLYFCMWILLIGAEINSYFEDKLRWLESAALTRLRKRT
ncbi:MAG TPA: YihY/virulence factor BrkB family protein [Candidatus Fusicatenibacter intestinigallinarum]|uniref:YihY/virulence factor BrkB family protein n=1 Tax=Candidatus Fusicatenibacter intestinigallinarum TaxID=2838598 RepID=A0A9D2N8P9_9FIRM|nr:YihY/virulence factor BrkB family protein [Candidatus Fusicatenibacter intestinigallinarum]